MQTLAQCRQLRNVVTNFRRENQQIALVATMGNLHEGHLNLVRSAQQHSNKVIVSIFVNPLQFGPTEDFVNYPRTLQQDQEKLFALNVDVLFTPTPEEIYPHPLQDHTCVEIPLISQDLCGMTRPTLFRGVCTVVTKLFNIVQPDIAVFGEKDWQQLHIIKQMVTDLNMSVKITSVPIARESDGLALSSRNHYLTPAERKIAPHLYATLQCIKQKILEGARDFTVLCHEATQILIQHGFKPDYFTIRRRKDLQSPHRNDKHLIILLAAFLGKTRLIDNVSVDL